MKKILMAGIVIASAALLAFGQSADDKKQALSVVNKLFAEMADANPAGILAVHTPDSQLVTVRKLKSGETKIQPVGGDAFSKMFANKTRVMREEMYAPNVEIHGDLALVWGRYVFFVDDKLSHCGVNTFNLVRTAAGWRIANGASTIDPNDCTEKEKSMKPTVKIK